jgi:uncharacterized protein (DUF433 family)
MDWCERIEVNPGVLLGTPVIKGTRLSIEFILELLAERWSDDQILASYSQLSYEDIRAALICAQTLQNKDREL